ncbi:hypothetical protein PFICI_00919 [Pestalotiopsis fici W106-1]|uniref:Uncharacterized protein n=1 Tax=Pestalotiopsis fici (strain W106-1 / CGMCC3.15140) TaxID=1229662 RepID=W3XP97_PESFW|nr:uncharacterized protein PFICI_00919 [Pestalotiopsis fici W106-1]ETS87091.1 hypothetical protein PFICI_00919 [Pestalotiopsis fici W106-1]
MSSSNCAVSKSVSNPKCNPTPQPSPSPSVTGMEDALKDFTLADESIVARYPPSLDTDSTLSAHTVVNQDLKSQIDFMAWVLGNESTQRQGLTHLALQAHNLNTKDSGYHRDLEGWCRDGDMFDRSDRQTGLTDSMLVTKRSKSHATEYTSSSYDMLSDFDPAADTDHDVNGAGAAFHDIPGPQLEDDQILSSM